MCPARKWKYINKWVQMLQKCYPSMDMLCRHQIRFRRHNYHGPAIAGTHLPVIAICEIRDSDNRKSTVTRHFVRRLSVASILLSCVQKALSGPARNLNGSQNTNYRTESFRSFQLLPQINLISTGVDVGVRLL